MRSRGRPKKQNPYNQTMHFRITNEQYGRLQAISDRYEIPKADILRKILERALIELEKGADRIIALFEDAEV